MNHNPTDMWVAVERRGQVHFMCDGENHSWRYIETPRLVTNPRGLVLIIVLGLILGSASVWWF